MRYLGYTDELKLLPSRYLKSVKSYKWSRTFKFSVSINIQAEVSKEYG